MTVKIEADGKYSTGIYIKREKLNDIILTTAHGIKDSNEQNIEIKYFFENNFFSLKIDTIIRSEENDIAVIILKENSLKRNKIPNVYFFERVSEEEKFKLQGFPLSLRNEIDPIQMLNIVINEENYNDECHEISFERSYADGITPDGTSGFSGGPIYKYFNECILLSGVYLGVKSQESIYHVGRVLKIKNINSFFEKNGILIDGKNTYIINKIFDKVKINVESQNGILFTNRQTQEYTNKLKNLKDYFLRNEKIFISLIQRMTCDEISDLFYAFDYYEKNIIELIYGILVVQDELKILEILEYKKQKYSLFNPISENEKNITVVLKKVLHFLNNKNEEEINNFIRFNRNVNNCIKICNVEKRIGEINIDFLSVDGIEKTNFLDLKSSKNMKFICAGCFENLENLKERGKDLWEK